MARGVNKVILIGNLGKDPETRSFPSGGSVTNVTVATSESWKDKDGNPQTHTEWHNVVFRNRLAEVVAQYLRKGSKVYVEGSLRTRKWQDKEGKDRYTVEVNATEMQMLDSKGAGGSSAPAEDYSHETRENRGNVMPRSSAAPASAPAPAAAESSFEDDDIPF